ncbi:MAG: dUTP diphosphatase [Acetobacteraceae bacterium]|nr:dUTP diphosphatase [Acetobacteraceae bacterium]
MAELRVPIRVLPGGEGLPLPAYMTPGSVGMDVPAAVSEPVTIPPGGRALIPAGFSLAIPEGYEAQLRPRSGLALEHGLTLLNSPGTLDPDYRGEVKVLLVNLGSAAFTVKRGDRVAQMVFLPVARARLIPARLQPTQRSGAGFGHTGL